MSTESPIRSRIRKISSVIAAFLPINALAGNPGGGSSGGVGSALNNLKDSVNGVYGSNTTIFNFVNAVIVTFFAILAVIFIAMMLYAGYNWMTAMGEAEKVTKAKDTIIAAVIGVIIILAAYAVTVFVIQNVANSVT